MDRHSETKAPSSRLVELVRWCGLFFSKILWRIEYHNTENIPQKEKSGLIISSNHQTYFDPFWVCFPVHRKLRFMAWDKAFNWFIIGRLIKNLGAFPVNLEGRGNLRAIKEAVRHLKKGETLVIFPEGERELSDGKLLEFKAGFFHLARLADVPILPVTIRGGNRVWSRNHKFPRPGKIEIYFHPVFYLPGPEKDPGDKDLIKKAQTELKEIISSKL